MKMTESTTYTDRKNAERSEIKAEDSDWKNCLSESSEMMLQGHRSANNINKKKLATYH